jgi:hypothetical protein
MTKSAKASPKIAGDVLIVSIPVAFAQQGGRKQIVVPPGAAAWLPRAIRCDNSLINALAKAHRWRGLIESGKCSSAAELSRSEKINESYLCRVLRLTLLAPDIVEASWTDASPERSSCRDYSNRSRRIGTHSVRPLAFRMGSAPDNVRS